MESVLVLPFGNTRWVLVALVLASPGLARAQEAAPGTPAAALRRVAASCKAETERFCPALAGTASPRSQAICLRPYRISLSLPCRGAVNSVIR